MLSRDACEYTRGEEEMSIGMYYVGLIGSFSLAGGTMEIYRVHFYGLDSRKPCYTSIMLFKQILLKLFVQVVRSISS